MTRNRKRKTERGQADGALMRRAVEEVINGKSVRGVAENLNLNRTTLGRYVNKVKSGVLKVEDDMSPRYNSRQVIVSSL